MRSRGFVASVAVATLVATGCGFGWQDRQIGIVHVAADDRALAVGHHCETDATVVAEEAADEVRLTFRTYGETGNDCADVEGVELVEPLDGRRVIDASNGAEITPCRPSTASAADDCD